MLSWEGSLLVWGGCVCLTSLGSPVNLWTTGTVCIVNPLCEVCASNVICVIFSVTVTPSRNFFVFQWMCVRSPVLIPIFVMSQSLIFSPYIYTDKCIFTQFGTQKSQHLQTLLFKHQNCLAHCMLLLWEGADRSVQLKIDMNMNLCLEKVMKKSLQQSEGHLPVVILY
jgi:hypothetical protein